MMRIIKNKTESDTAVAIGNFDGVHIGHRALFERCAAEAENSGLLPLVFTFCNHPRAALGQGVGLLCSAEKKLELCGACGMKAAFVQRFDRDFAALEAGEFVERYLIKKLRAKKVFCGEGFRFGRGAASDEAALARELEKYGASLETVELERFEGSPVSSTRIRRALGQGEVALAARLLGRRFSLSGEVVKGRQLGRTIGIPTVNLAVAAELALPKRGVYKTECAVAGRGYAAVTNIGTRPTVGGKDVTIESFIIGFDGDVYGKTVEIEFLKYLRPERRFDSLEALAGQIREDVKR